MPYYRKCSFCGAHLDPGEKCDCQRGKGELDRNSLFEAEEQLFEDLEEEGNGKAGD